MSRDRFYRCIYLPLQTALVVAAVAVAVAVIVVVVVVVVNSVVSTLFVVLPIAFVSFLNFGIPGRIVL